VAFFAFFVGVASAGAHAELVSSVPASGATVTTAPTQVLAVFSERPDPRLSSMSVTDQSGMVRGGGRPTPVAAHPTELTVPIEGRGDGSYTVRWRAVSADDGHVSSGSFTFAVRSLASAVPSIVAPVPLAGPAPDGGPAGGIGLPAPAHRTPRPSVLAVTARWIYYLGLMGLLGGAFIGLAVFRSPPAHLLRWALPVSWVLCMAGCLGISESQRSAAGVSLGHLMSSSVGHTMMFRGTAGLEIAVPIAVAIIGVGLARAAGLAAVCVTAALAMLSDVRASHAAAAHSWAWLQIGLQWVHFMAVGVWIGGLAAVLICLPGVEARTRAAGIRRFSTAAGIALFAMAGTGALRSVDEVGSWGRLFSTGFGQLVVIKIGVVAILASLGAINRYFNVPLAGRTVGGLRRLSVVEIGLAGAALIATALLQNLAAPATAAPLRPQTTMDSSMVWGSDARNTTRAGITVDPGTRGVNQFRVALSDYQTAAPLGDAGVTLRFALTGQPGYGESDLTLAPEAPGVYQADGGDISAEGIWRITVIVRRSSRQTEIPLRVTTSRSMMPMDTTGP
jgi:copper transport protein